MLSLRCVGRVERIRYLDGHPEHLLPFHRAAGDHMLQSLAVQKFHGDEGVTILFADVVNGADVRAEAACASRWKRASACESFANPSGKNFRATKRCRRVSSALYTTPISPPPSFSMMR